MINPLVYLKANNITFTGDMVPAIFDLIKRHTRRPLKPLKNVPDKVLPGILKNKQGDYVAEILRDQYDVTIHGLPGDLLWVQEGYKINKLWHWQEAVNGFYTADRQIFFQQRLTHEEWSKLKKRKYPYRPSPGRFMYKSLCRLVIEIEAVKFERVQDISEEDAKGEGVCGEFFWNPGGAKVTGVNGVGYKPYVSYRDAFSYLWDSMYAGTDFAWAKNPWVEVIKFKPVDLKKLKAWILENRDLAEAGMEQFSRQVLLEEARSEKQEGVIK